MIHRSCAAYTTSAYSSGARSGRGIDLNMATRRSEDESGPMPENGAAADGATAEQPWQSSPRVKASRFRAAYEALIEPLVNATVKVVGAETEHQILRAQIGSLQAEIATLQARLA